jgi:hypothetical protein
VQGTESAWAELRAAGTRPMNAIIVRPAAAVAAALLAATLLGCGSLRSPESVPAGASIDEARQSLVGLSGEYALPGGGTRLEFRRGRETYMLDFDASGKLVSSQQVLTPSSFAAIAPGMSEGDVRSRIGGPSFVFGIGWQERQVWNYRFGAPEGDCVVFQVSFSNDTHTVADAGQNTDPGCGGRFPRGD